MEKVLMEIVETLNSMQAMFHVLKQDGFEKSANSVWNDMFAMEMTANKFAKVIDKQIEKVMGKNGYEWVLKEVVK